MSTHETNDTSGESGQKVSPDNHMQNDIQPNGDQQPAETSKLAIAALIVSLFACCPVTSVVAVFLAVRAIRQIEQSKGTIGGLRHARVALLIAGISFVVQLVTFSWWEQWQAEQFESETSRLMTECIRSTQKGPDGSHIEWSQYWTADVSDAVEETTFMAFGDVLSERYGDVQNFSVSQALANPILTTVESEGNGILAFTSDDVLVAFKVQSTAALMSIDVRFVELYVFDAQRGDIQLSADGLELKEAKKPLKDQGDEQSGEE